MKYLLRTSVAIFEIKPHRSDVGRVELWINGDPFCPYNSAQQAASYVYGRQLGFDPWDFALNIEAPEDLSGWEHSSSSR